MPDGSYQPKVYRKQGGDELVVASGGKITVESGGEIEFASGGLATLPTGLFHVDLLTGQDGGSDPTYTLTGAAVGDEIVFVGHFTTAASIASFDDVTADFSVTAGDELTDGGPTDYSNDQLMVIWIDRTP